MKKYLMLFVVAAALTTSSFAQTNANHKNAKPEKSHQCSTLNAQCSMLNAQCSRLNAERQELKGSNERARKQRYAVAVTPNSHL